MDLNTEAIVCMAWSRELGLVDEAFSGASEGTVVVDRPDADLIAFVTLFGRSVLIGPPWALERGGRYADEELAAPRVLLQIVRDRRARLVDASTLALVDSYITDPAIDAATLTGDPEAMARLEALCPPDDVVESGLREMSATFLLAGADEQVVAGAGYRDRQGIIAELGALTAHGQRGRGHGRAVAAIAANDALDEGMIPLSRVRAGNDRARRVAESLGFVECGTQTVVALE